MAKKQLITWLTVIYVILLTTLCLIQISAPTPELPGIGFDKVVHFCFYIVLNSLLISTIIAHKGKVVKMQIIATTILSMTYGVVIEFVQQYVGRDFDIYDIVANSLGAIAGGLLLCSYKVQNLIDMRLR